jgi:Tfp pilus assembly protein PilO
MRSLQNSISALENDVLEESVRTAELQRRASIDVSASAGWDLADQKNVVLFFEDVSGTARRIGVSLVGVHPAQELDKERYKEVSMNLDLKGRYRELGEYFERLESLQKVVNVRKIRIESCPDSSSVCAAQIEAVTFMPK